MQFMPCIRNNCWKLSLVLLSKQSKNVFSSSYLLSKRLKCTNVTFERICYPLLPTVKFNLFLTPSRTYSKKKKISKQKVESDEESDSEEDDFENLEADEIGDGFNITTKAVPSMRIDTVVKAALGISKKKVEKEFYASNLRVNGEKVLKKSMIVSEGDEVDLVKEPSPDNDRFLIVDRVIVKAIGKINQAGNYPLKMQVFKKLTIENYSNPWIKETSSESD